MINFQLEMRHTIGCLAGKNLANPTSIRFIDFFIVTVTVLVIGFLASLLPSRKAARIQAYIREE